MSADLERQLRQTNTLLREFLKKEQKETWVSAVAIMKATGWNNSFMKIARRDGIVQFRIVDKSYQYLIESIPEVFFRKAS